MELRRRQALIAALIAQTNLRHEIGRALANVGYLERLTGRVTQGQASIREYLTLGSALCAVLRLVEHLAQTGLPALVTLSEQLDACDDAVAMIAVAVEEDGDGGGRIRAGYDRALDQTNDGVRETRTWLAGLERAERDRT